CPLLAQVAAGSPEARIARCLQPYVDRSKVAGAVVLVADRDKVLALEGVGFADIAARTPMRHDTLFWIASQSKPITATALMMLVDEGKVSLDAPVARYLPEFQDQWLAVEHDKDHILLRRPKHPITVRNILSHTSGMPFRSEVEQPTLDLLPLRTGVRSYAMTPLDFEPDSHYQYSNAGINTAGRIIEVVSGMAYDDFLDRRLFQPLGMKDTTFWPNPEQVARLAKSYKPSSDKAGLEAIAIAQLRYPLGDRKRQPMPAGGLFSTAGDLGLFCRMILNGGILDGKRYLSESAIAEMTSRQTGNSIKENYGLGWATSGEARKGARPIIPGPCGHGGAYATNMWIDPRRQLITVFMVQYAGPGEEIEKVRSAFMKVAADAFGK
ncbi:MAG: serine hydrolase domain-containing protein, partial [Isosphaeraceae bacterium]